MSIRSIALASLLSIGVALGVATAARADGTIAVTYYIVPEHHPDVDHGVDGTTVTGLVEKRLGPHGFPVATRFARTKGGSSSGPIHDVNHNGEILWWSTTSPHGVRVDAVGHAKLPLVMTAMFPAGHRNDADGFRTAHFRGTFVAGAREVAGVKLGSDDDAWVFVDGELKVDNGGVKAMTFTPYSLGSLAPGTHTMDIFYADRFGANAAVEIDTPLVMAPAPIAAPARPGAMPVPKRGPSLTAAQMRAQLTKTGRFTLRDIHFAFDRADITPDSAAVLGEVGKVLQADARLRLSVEGHTDGAGDAAYNRALSQRRAQAVVAYLVTRSGVAASRLTATGYGASRPVANNATSVGRALNRRVEFVKR